MQLPVGGRGISFGGILATPTLCDYLLLLLNHTPRAYDSSQALRLCGPSTYYYHYLLEYDICYPEK